MGEEPKQEKAVTQDDMNEQLFAISSVLMTAVVALFKTHPDPVALRKCFVSMCETDTANSLHRGLSNGVLEREELFRRGLLLSLSTTPTPRG